MGLLTGLITLPLAPVRGVVWLAGRLAEQAENELYDEGSIHRQLDEIRAQRDAGELSEPEYDAKEDELIARLLSGHARRTR